MTEKSYFWDYAGGAPVGDDTYAPYNAEEYNFFHFTPITAEDLGVAYVIPYYEDDLEVVTAGTEQHAVVVKTGAALFNNYLYILDEEKVVPIDRAASGYYRRDRIVLRFDQTTSDPKTELAVIQGPASLTAAGATLPTLTQTLGTYEVCLADIYISGYVTSILSSFVNDQRKFIYTAMSHINAGGQVGNLLENSEFLGYSHAGVGGKSPDRFIPNGSGTGIYSTSLNYGSGRDNRGLVFDTSVSGYLRQMVPAGSSKVYTLSGYMNSSGASSTNIYIRAYRKNGTLSSVSKYWATNGLTVTDEHFQITVKFPEDDIETLDIYFTNTLTDAELMQVVLAAGYHPGQQRPVNELLMLSYGIPSASWTATAKSSGTTTIDLVTGFGAVTSAYIKGVVLRLRARDSGSAAAANCFLRALGYVAPYNGIYGSLEIGGVTNSNWREMRCIVPTDQIYWDTGVGGAQFRLQVGATGANTLDATVELVGLLI